MKRYISYAILLAVIFTSCKKSDDDYDSEIKQYERIESFLNSNYPGYTTMNGVYRARLNVLPTQGEMVTKGDLVTVRYAIYGFKTKIDSLVLTNIESEAIKNGFNTEFFDLSPLEIEYGTTNIIEGMNIGLQNLKTDDSVYIFMPSSLGYGDKINGVVGKNKSLAVFINIISIKNN